MKTWRSLGDNWVNTKIIAKATNKTKTTAETGTKTKTKTMTKMSSIYIILDLADNALGRIICFLHFLILKMLKKENQHNDQNNGCRLWLVTDTKKH